MELKERVQDMGGQLFVEVRPSHHPEIRVCYSVALHYPTLPRMPHEHNKLNYNANIFSPATY